MKISIALLITLVVSAANISAQTTAFTYQGRLNNNGAPANGNYEMQFTLFDALEGGEQVGVVTDTSVAVINGIFTATLDFSAPSPFDSGGSRYLEIAVRPAGPTPPAFTILSPRQEIKSSPYAIRARSAATADNATQLNGQSPAFYQSASNLTAGTLPDARLSGNVALLNAENTFTATKNIFTGKVGIGVTAPLAALEVNGDIIRTIARAQGFNQGDDTNNGALTTRLVNFTKRHNDTGLRVTYTDNIRVLTSNSAGRWEIRFNGASATPTPLAWDMFNGSNGVNRHIPTTFTGTVFNLPAGAYLVRVYVGPSPGYGVTDLYTGWQGAWSLEVEEVR